MRALIVFLLMVSSVVAQEPIIRRVGMIEEMYLGTLEEESRVYKTIRYQETWERVPVINGIVPAIMKRPDKIMYFYELGKPLKECDQMYPVEIRPFKELPVKQNVPFPETEIFPSKPTISVLERNPVEVGYPDRIIKPTYK